MKKNYYGLFLEIYCSLEINLEKFEQKNDDLNFNLWCPLLYEIWLNVEDSHLYMVLADQ